MNNFIIERFTEGHIFYSSAHVTNLNPERGVVGTFRPVFGRMMLPNNILVCYTMERFDTLIPNGTYEFDLYDSPHNKLTVPRLTKDEKGIDISQRFLEVHPANYLWQLKGCTAPGMTIDKKTSSILNSRDAFKRFMNLLGEDKTGTITYVYK